MSDDKSDALDKLLELIRREFKFVKLPEDHDPVNVQITIKYPGATVKHEFSVEDKK